MRNLITLALFACLSASLCYGHEHTHGHSHEEPSFKYSKEANDANVGDNLHTTDQEDINEETDSQYTWIYALGSTALISAAPVVILFFIPAICII